MNVEQAALLKKADRALRTAELALKDVDFDGAASRSYYVMFYASQAMLLGLGLSFSHHSAVIAAFGREFAKPGKVPAHMHRFLMESEAFLCPTISSYSEKSTRGEPIALP